ncbi:MAG: phytanoyl-CoA dioxygenase family protein [Ktedonobacteraceae bacterium]
MQEKTFVELPDLSQKYPLPPEFIQQYQKNGHILLREVASPTEVTAYWSVVGGAALHYNTEKRTLQERDTYGKAFLQIMNLWERDEAVKRFVLASRFASIASALMGVERVRLYHDQALFKEAGGGPTPWHQDEYYWPLDTNNMITMWMPLVDVSVAMGPMIFANGSQREGFLGHFAISDESQATFQHVIEQHSLSLSTPQALTAGDATFHAGWTLHSALANTSDTMREVMTIIYFADGAHIVEPDNPDRANDIQRWLTGLKPGDLAASPKNPLV